MNMRADPVSAIRSRLSLTRVDSYGVLLLLLLVIGAWLVADFVRERDRIMAERSRLAINKSQLMNRSFGDTFLAADYVLRDVLGRARMGKDLAYPQPEAEVTARLEALLKEKVLTVAGLTDLVLFNGDCIFAATANYPTRGTKSRQRFCSDARVEPGQSLHIQYMPPVNSASARPVVLMSRRACCWVARWWWSTWSTPSNGSPPSKSSKTMCWPWSTPMARCWRATRRCPKRSGCAPRPRRMSRPLNRSRAAPTSRPSRPSTAGSASLA